MYGQRMQMVKLLILLASYCIFFQSDLMVRGVNNAFRFHNPYAHNVVVGGVSHRSVSKRSAIECGMACEEDEDCVSFNFGKKDRTCQLYSQRMDDIGETPKDGYRYYELPRDGK